MRSWLGWLFSLLVAAQAAALPSVPETARGEGVHDGDETRVDARLLADAARAAPGVPFRAGVLLTLDPGWHVYWRNSGESGLPTQLLWKTADARVGPIQWPAPAIFREGDGLVTTYGYDRQVLLQSAIEFPADARGERELRVVADFVACEVQCIPGRIELSRRIELGDAEPADPATLRLFEHWRERVPVAPDALGLQLETRYSQSAIRPGDSFRAALSVVSCSEVAGDCTPWRLAGRPADAFVPDMPKSMALEVTGTSGHPDAGGAVLLLLSGKAGAKPPSGEERLRGVLSVERRGTGVRWVEVDLPLPRAAAGAHVEELALPGLDARMPPHAPQVSAWAALGLALLGGLILNLMPCVLPVLAIKLFGISEAVQHGRTALRHSAWAYLLGIESAMLGLALVVFALRAAGTAVGWGFQFQEPAFLALISAVLVVFAANLFGVFEISLDASGLTELPRRAATRARRSFFEGLLAVALATPCSAPFLGTAVGFAFASPAWVATGIFLGIGSGLALPYLLVANLPALARWLPRPGIWMLQVRRLLGFAVLASVVWLLSIPSSASLVVAILAWLVAIAAATWIGGSLQAAGRRGAARATALLVAAGLLASLRSLPQDGVPTAPAASPAAGSWRPFEPAAINAELEAGRAVFVDFTADWCLTCKANERLVLADARVVSEFERLGIARFKADWTRRDERIRAELARHGKAGVPLYLVYGPHAPAQPIVLPELLTVERVVEALRSAAGPARLARARSARIAAARGGIMSLRAASRAAGRPGPP